MTAGGKCTAVISGLFKILSLIFQVLGKFYKLTMAKLLISIEINFLAKCWILFHFLWPQIFNNVLFLIHFSLGISLLSQVQPDGEGQSEYYFSHAKETY